MSFLPLVERELRVAARRKDSYWIRSLTALVAVIFLVPNLGMALIWGGATAGGAEAFAWMTWFIFGVASLAGAFLGADAIAEERREGTLGFLFLTDLKSYDVALGKFFSASLPAFYSMLAALPILAVCVYGGGVMAGEFWRVSIALVNSLFFAVALSLLVSARTKSDIRPLGNALAILSLAFIAGSAAQVFSGQAANLNAAAALRWLSLFSPGETVYLASAANYLSRAGDFWWSLALTQAAGWGFLALASWRLDTLVGKKATEPAGKRKRRNRKLLEVNPITWLLDDSRAMKIAVWSLAGMGAVLVCGAIFAADADSPGFLVTWPFVFILKVLFAIQSCRFFTEGRRSGALELLRTTPFGGQKIVAGQWIALRRIFLWPVLLLMGAELGSWIIEASLSSSVHGVGVHGVGDVAGFIYFFYQVITIPLDFYAAGWTGMWISLTARIPSRAAWLTVVFVIILPAIIPCLPTFLIDAVLIAIFNDKLVRRLNIYLAVRQDETGDERAMIRS